MVSGAMVQGAGRTDRSGLARDRTRCDCVTDTHAIEFDSGSGWAESIGQGLHYSAISKKKAGMVLISDLVK